MHPHPPSITSIIWCAFCLLVGYVGPWDTPFGPCCFHHATFSPKFCFKKLPPMACRSHTWMVSSTMCLFLSPPPLACRFHVSSHMTSKTLPPMALRSHEVPQKDDHAWSAVLAGAPPLPPVGGFGLRPGQGRQRSRRLTPTRPDLKGLRPRAGRVGRKREEEDVYSNVHCDIDIYIYIYFYIYKIYIYIYMYICFKK